MRDTPEEALIWQYRGKPRARQTVGLLFSESRELWTSALTLASLLDIDGAGVFYRLGGALNDSTRLDDDDYRFLLRARVLKNTQRPTLAAISTTIRTCWAHRPWLSTTSI